MAQKDIPADDPADMEKRRALIDTAIRAILNATMQIPIRFQDGMFATGLAAGVMCALFAKKTGVPLEEVKAECLKSLSNGVAVDSKVYDLENLPTGDTQH